MNKSGELTTVRPVGTPLERFHNKYVVNEQTGCWEWTAAKNRGYALHTGEDGQPIRASRFAFEAYHGKIPDGLDILHSCDNPGCVNPDHLSAGTKKENMQQCSARGRTAGQRGKVKRRFSDAMRQNMRIMYARNYSLEFLEYLYGTTHSTVRNVVKGKTI